MDKSEMFAKEILKKMTLEEKAAQLSQTIAGYRCYNRRGDEFEFEKDFKDFIAKYGAMGAISNILRSCAWTKKDWGIGIEPKHRARVANQLQKYVLDNTRLQIPVLIEVEANHGLQALGSEMFPTNIGMGCTFNTALYKEIMKTVGKETKLSGNHMDFVTMFDMARDPRWGRVEEFFSEDPYLASEYAKNGVEGLKEENVLVCCKHYCATGDCFGGINTAEVNIGKRELHDIHLPVVEKAVNAGADVVMAAYNTVDSIPCHVNSYLLNEVLRGELGFDGIILSDGWGVERMVNQMRYNPVKGSSEALKAGIDISLADNGMYLNLITAVREGKLDEEYIDNAVMRVLKKKFEIGLFDNPFVSEDNELETFLDSGVQKELSYKAACESVVMTKNNGILPLKKETKLSVIGVTADDLYYLLGSYTSLRKKGEGKTLLEAICDKFDSVVYSKGWDFENSEEHFEEAINNSKAADAVIFVMGGSSAGAITKTEFDKNTGAQISSQGFIDCGEGMDVADISLAGNQQKLLKMIRELNKPIISVMIQGRPYIITDAEKMSDAVLLAWYPGQQGGDAIADIISGKVNPSGKLSVSIPYSQYTLPAYYNRVWSPDAAFDECCTNSYKDYPQRILHPFGFGLSYSKFSYGNLRTENVGKNEFLVYADVKNISEIGGYETVQLYINGYDNSIRRRGKELKGFEKVYINPGETKTVCFRLGYDELKIYSAREKYEIEEAPVSIMVGSNPNLPLRTVIYTSAQTERE